MECSGKDRAGTNLERKLRVRPNSEPCPTFVFEWNSSGLTGGQTASKGVQNMGYALAMGACVRCKRIFSFNPVRVPSLKVNGVKEPICADCIKWANPRRVAAGLEPFIPAPDAYEACNELELGGD
jgi:hypothetical protein